MLPYKDTFSLFYDDWDKCLIEDNRPLMLSTHGLVNGLDTQIPYLQLCVFKRIVKAVDAFQIKTSTNYDCFVFYSDDECLCIQKYDESNIDTVSVNTEGRIYYNRINSESYYYLCFESTELKVLNHFLVDYFYDNLPF